MNLYVPRAVEPSLALSRNQRQVLTLLRDRGTRSRAALADQTGASPTTITKAVAPLIAAGIVREGPQQSAGVGRPATALHLVPDAFSVCGIQIGVGWARIGLTNAKAKILNSASVEFDPELPAEEVLDTVAQQVRRLLAANEGGPCIGAGVVVPGPVDVSHRRITMTINLDWADAPVADILEARLGLPTIIEQNVRSMALAEARYGKNRPQNLAYVYVRSGVGMGLVLRGSPFQGGQHGVSYFGHFRVVDDGLPCACGARGCLETLVAEPYLRRRLDELGVPSQPSSAVYSDLESTRSSDGAIQGLRGEVIRHLAHGLGAVVNLLNLELLIVGGALAEAPDQFLGDLERATREAIVPVLRSELTLSRTSLAEPGISGAAAVALESSLYLS